TLVDTTLSQAHACQINRLHVVAQDLVAIQLARYVARTTAAATTTARSRSHHPRISGELTLNDPGPMADNVRARLVRTFLRDLARELTPAKILMIWDRLNFHRARLVQDFSSGGSTTLRTSSVSCSSRP